MVTLQQLPQGLYKVTLPENILFCTRQCNVTLKYSPDCPFDRLSIICFAVCSVEVWHIEVSPVMPSSENSSWLRCENIPALHVGFPHCFSVVRPLLRFSRFSELRVYFEQTRVGGDCWNSVIMNQDGFVEFHFVSEEFDWIVFYDAEMHFSVNGVWWLWWGSFWLNKKGLFNALLVDVHWGCTNAQRFNIAACFTAAALSFSTGEM